MKRIVAVIILIIMTVSFLLPIFSFESCAMEQRNAEIENMNQIEKNISVKELSIIHMNKEIDSISYLREMNKLEWYKAYKDIFYKYRNVIEPTISVFDVYTEDEMRLICRAIETECYGQSFESKVMVANVIYNRLESKEYGSSVEEVITSKNQFAYWRESISEDTLYASMFGFEMGDLSDGSLAFHSNEKTDKFAGRDYVFTDKSSGHHFYR